MNTVLYGDILFIINFSMDFLTLFATSKILHLKTKLLPLCISASVGAVYAVAAVLFEGAIIIGLIINVAVSFLMCYIAFNKNLIKCTALFYSIGLVMGGALTASFSLINRIKGSSTIFVNGSTAVLSGNIPLGWMAVIAIITCIAAILSGQFASYRKFSAEVTVRAVDGDRKVKFLGITDSGNLLKDPFDGTPVIVTNKQLLLTLIPNEAEEYFVSGAQKHGVEVGIEAMRKIRAIPSVGISGTGGLLMGYIPDCVFINGKEVRACIAADCGTELSADFGGSEAIVPAVLL